MVNAMKLNCLCLFLCLIEKCINCFFFQLVFNMVLSRGWPNVRYKFVFTTKKKWVTKIITEKNVVYDVIAKLS